MTKKQFGKHVTYERTIASHHIKYTEEATKISCLLPYWIIDFISTPANLSYLPTCHLLAMLSPGLSLFYWEIFFFFCKKYLFICI